MNAKRIVIVTTLILALASSLATAQQSKRLALLIGNSAYEGNLKLANPVNDADAMGETLKQVGFDVTVKKNRNKREIESDVLEATGKLAEGDVFLFFYAGHGLERRKVNYLQPIGSKVETEADIESQCVDTDWILDEVKKNNASLKILIIDACRSELPIAKVVQTRSFMPAPEGTIIAFAVESGMKASDGIGDNSPYTKSLVDVMQQEHASGLEITDWLRRSAKRTRKETGQRSFVDADWSMDPFMIKQTGVSIIDQRNNAQAFDVSIKVTNEYDSEHGYPVFHDGESVEFEIESEADGYLTLVTADPEGEVAILIPNDWNSGSVKVEANRKMKFPTWEMGFKIQAQPPHGQTLVKAIVTKRPLKIKGDKRGAGFSSLGKVKNLQTTRGMPLRNKKRQKAKNFDVKVDRLSDVFNSDEWASSVLTVNTLPAKRN